MGRKISEKERVGTKALKEIVNTTHNEKIKLQAGKILLEHDQQEKARAEAREKVRLAYRQNKEIAGLGSQIQSLEKDLKAKNDSIAEAKGGSQEEIQKAKDVLKNEFDIKISAVRTEEQSFITSLLAYSQMPEYQPSVLILALQSRAKHGLSKENKRDLGRGIAMLDRDFRGPQDDLAELEKLQKDTKKAWELYQIAIDGNDTAQARGQARRSLKLVYGWTETTPTAFADPNKREIEIKGLKARTAEEILASIRCERYNKTSKEDSRQLVKSDNKCAEYLCELAGKDVGQNVDSLGHLQLYRQCSNCKHISHVSRTREGQCYHCEKISAEWILLVEAQKDVPYCAGLFPCSLP